MHNVSQWPNLRHLGESLGGAEGLVEAVSFKKAKFTFYLLTYSLNTYCLIIIIIIIIITVIIKYRVQLGRFQTRPAAVCEAQL